MTAKELIEKRLSVRTDYPDEEITEETDVFDSVGEIKDAMIGFAAYHVQKALEAVYEQNEEILSKEIIMNAYPLDLIE
jgi:hypothetical protein